MTPPWRGLPIRGTTPIEHPVPGISGRKTTAQNEATASNPNVVKYPDGTQALRTDSQQNPDGSWGPKQDRGPLLPQQINTPGDPCVVGSAVERAICNDARLSGQQPRY